MSREDEIKHFLSLPEDQAKLYARKRVDARDWKAGDALMAMKYWRSKHASFEDQPGSPDSVKEIFG